MNPRSEELRRFAQAMLDVDRLKIVGELARRSATVDRLAAETGMPPEQVRSHLRALRLAGVVTMVQRAGDEPAFGMDTRGLERMARRQFAARSARKKIEPDLRQIGPEISARDAKRIRSLTFKNGRVRLIPGPNKIEQVRALVLYALQLVEPGRTYTERDISALFAAITDDPASIRRYAVDLGLMARSRDGASYWRVEVADE